MIQNMTGVNANNLKTHTENIDCSKSVTRLG